MPNLYPNGDAEVKVAQQGNLKFEQLTGIGETVVEKTFTVPSGKIWTLKAIGYSLASGNTTDASYRIQNIGASKIIRRQLETGGYDSTLLDGQAISLPEGWSIKIKTTTATALDHYHNLLIQESGA